MTELGLGAVLRLKMAEQSVSMRDLSRLTGISAASISRIIGNKQPAKLNHLLLFSKHLDIPLERLLRAIGNNVECPDNNKYQFLEIFQAYDIDLNNLITDIQKDLKKYEQYAKTAEGKKIILNECEAKINEIHGEGAVIENLKALYRLFVGSSAGPDEKTAAGSALLYFILSADVIPDYDFPVGYLDDAIAVNLVVSQLPKELLK